MIHNNLMNKLINESLINLEFSPSYFNDEIREGFYVPEMMKRYWAGQLKVLSEIAKICEKHDIFWAADYGSLIGAVRHGGYIPWDDDFDICMLRHDYNRFISAAKTELPDGFQLLNIEDEPEYENMLGRVVNWNAINIGPERLRNFYGCPYTVGIDIFILDGVFPNKELEDKRLRSAREVAQAIILINQGKQDTPECRAVLANIERQNHVVLHRRKDLKRELNLLSLELYRQYSSENAEKVAFMPLWVNERNHLFSKELFVDYVYAKFENTFIKIPALYEELLRNEYGDYMKVYRAGGVHDYPLYSGQEKILKERTGGKNPFRYKFPDEIEQIIQNRRKKKPFADYCREVLELMKTVSFQLKELFLSGSYDVMYRLLEGCQPMAISLGDEIEKRESDCSGIIGLLEKYCEIVYVCHEGLAEGSFTNDKLSDLESSVLAIEKELGVFLKNRKRHILLLPCSPMWWESMATVYDERVKDPQNECTIVPVPCFQKDLDNKVIGILEDTCKYPDYVNSVKTEFSNAELKEMAEQAEKMKKTETLEVVTVENIENTEEESLSEDISKSVSGRNYYDEIIIQFPFDMWNRSMTIAPQVCSDVLAKHTDSLIYVPCFIPEFHDRGDEKLYESLKILVEQPTVVYSDMVILHSEKERKAYLSIANELTGGRYTEYWEKKFTFIEREKGHSEQSKKEEIIRELNLPYDFLDKKIVILHFCISSLLQYKEHAVKRLEDTIANITEQKEQIKYIYSQGSNVNELKRIDPKLWEEYVRFIEALKNEGTVYFDENEDAMRFISIADGYYGDGDFVAHYYRNSGVPVMIRKAY